MKKNIILLIFICFSVQVFAQTQEVLPTDETSKTRLFVIDITGNRERELETPEDASDPSWSPLYSNFKK